MKVGSQPETAEMDRAEVTRVREGRIAGPGCDR